MLAAMNVVMPSVSARDAKHYDNMKAKLRQSRAGQRSDAAQQPIAAAPSTAPDAASPTV